MRDHAGLQKYADFLKACRDAMPHIRGLTVLDDCKENRKLVARLPDPLISRWSREVTNSIDTTSQYPPFRQFVMFMDKEARVANNPVASFSAIKGQNNEPSKEETNNIRALSTLSQPSSATNNNKEKL